MAYLAEPIAHAVEITAGTEPDIAKLGVAIAGPQELVITTAVPTPNLPEQLVNIRPVHRPTVEALGGKAFRPEGMVSNGPFVLTEWVPQSRIVVRRNPRYWDAPAVRLDGVIFLPIESQSELVKRYRAGEIDMSAILSGDIFDVARQIPAAEIAHSSDFGVYYIGFNLEQPPFKDNLKLREALSLAIDREVIAHNVVGEIAEPAYGWVPSVVPGYVAQSFAWRSADRLSREAMARAAYAAAGYGPDHPLKLDLRYNTSDVNKKLMIAIAGMWKQVLGVETILTNEEFKSFLVTRMLKKVTQAFRGAYFPFVLDPYSLDQLLLSHSPENDTGYANAQYDEILAQATHTADPAARFRLLEQAERLVLADLPVAPIFHYQSLRLISPAVKGWQPSPRDTFAGRDLWLER